MKKTTPKHEGMKKSFGHQVYNGAAKIGASINLASFNRHYRRLFRKGPKPE